jgi:hypothetical protein
MSIPQSGDANLRIGANGHFSADRPNQSSAFHRGSLALASLRANDWLACRVEARSASLNNVFSPLCASRSGAAVFTLQCASSGDWRCLLIKVRTVFEENPVVQGIQSLLTVTAWPLAFPGKPLRPVPKDRIRLTVHVWFPGSGRKAESAGNVIAWMIASANISDQTSVSVRCGSDRPPMMENKNPLRRPGAGN